jgi:hypothetical protein
MISTAELERRLESARGLPVEEAAFFGCLLDAKLYAHVPLSDDRATLRFIQFRHPDGFDALPFFTSKAKADLATQSAVRVVSIDGRLFFEATRGAILMLNPNDGGCVLYPEEIDALLTTGQMPRVETSKVDAPVGMLVSEEFEPPIWLVPTLSTVFDQLATVQSAYMLEKASPETPDEKSLLIILAVPAADSERAVRATITATQPLCERDQVSMDLTTFDPVDGKSPYEELAKQFYPTLQ